MSRAGKQDNYTPQQQNSPVRASCHTVILRGVVLMSTIKLVRTHYVIFSTSALGEDSRRKIIRSGNGSRRFSLLNKYFFFQASGAALQISPASDQQQSRFNYLLWKWLCEKHLETFLSFLP